ncbi:hypothetical protein, partial [Streptomyces calidiresistens]
MGLPAAALLVVWLLALVTLPVAPEGAVPGLLLASWLVVLLLVPPVLLVSAVAAGRLLISLERDLADLRSRLRESARGEGSPDTDRSPAGERGLPEPSSPCVLYKR